MGKDTGEAGRFDADMTLMTGELNKLLSDLVFALGGETSEVVEEIDDELTDLVRLHSENSEKHNITILEFLNDGLYEQAVDVVKKSRRASVSLIQRSLQIDYYRAAQLIDQMEALGMIGELQLNGHRNVLTVDLRSIPEEVK